MKAEAKAFWDRNSSPKAQKQIAKVAKLVGADPKAMHAVYNATYDLDDFMPWTGADIIPDDARQHVIDSGLANAPFSVTPAAAIKRLVGARDSLELQDVATAFASSLLSGRPDHRSILGTFACFADVDESQLLDASKINDALNGLHSGRKRSEYDPMRVIFTRFYRSNSMEHDSVIDAVLEFEDFAPVSDCDTKSCGNTIQSLLDAIRALASDAQLAELNKSLQGVFKGNKLDRQHVLETLAYCDILQPQSQPVFRGTYKRLGSCPLPAQFYKKEWQYPACWWTGEDSVNESAVDFWFGHLL